MDLRHDQYKAGDVLQVVGELDELIIEKVWLSTQGSYRWVDYETRTRRSNQRVIVSVEYDDGDWEATLYDQFPRAYELPQAAELPSQLQLGEMTFHRAEQGRCRMRLLADDAPELSCDYADYTGPNNATIAVERFGDGTPESPREAEIYVGRTLRPSDLQLYAPIDMAERPGLIINRPSTSRKQSTGPRSVTLSMQQLVIGAIVVIGVLIMIFTLF